MGKLGEVRFNHGINELILNSQVKLINIGLGIKLDMKRQPEIFKSSHIEDQAGLITVAEKNGDKAYYVGHRFEDEFEEISTQERQKLNVMCFRNDFIYGSIATLKLNDIANFLSKNFISGYIVWFKDDFMFTDSEFIDMFASDKKTCLLTSIYQGKWSGKDFIIDTPEKVGNLISGMLFTESGEQGFTYFEHSRN